MLSAASPQPLQHAALWDPQDRACLPHMHGSWPVAGGPLDTPWILLGCVRWLVRKQGAHKDI